MEIRKLEGIIEAILFTMGGSVELGRLAGALEEPQEHIREAIAAMQERYRAEDRGINIVELEGAYQMCTKPEAYDYHLACEVGRLDAPGRPLLFGTTEEFLRRFSVQKLEDLPGIGPEQMESFKEEAEDEAKIQLHV